MPAKFVGDQIIRICTTYNVSRYWMAKELEMRESTVSRWARDIVRASVPAQKMINQMEKKLERKQKRDTARRDIAPDE